jgi:MYXO-CTERM domain-containing protein
MRSAKVGVLSLGLMAACSSEPSSLESERKPGPQVLPAREDAATSTLDYIHERRLDFGLRAPKEQLVTKRTSIDELSMTHVRMQQVERGLRVTGGEMNVHYDRAGRLTSIQQYIVPGLETLDLTPSIDAAKAKELAIASKPGHEVQGEPELVVLGDGSPALAWEMTVTSGLTSAWQVRVDAKNGSVLSTGNMVHSLTGSGIGLDGQRHPVNFALDEKNNNVMVDITRKVQIRMNDAKGGQSFDLITSTDTTSWDATSTTGKGSAVSAALVIGQVNDFFFKEWNRRGWDGLNGDEVIVVHVGNPDNTPMDNAFYTSANNLVAIGDGATLFKPLGGALDVLAHELGHAITGTTAKLAFGNQPGTLNEHISDVFGAVVEHGIKPDPVNNWLIGEGTLLAGNGPLRDMGAPEKGFSKQPRHMKEFVQTAEDDGGVHINNGIGNNAAFLATVGGTNAVSGITVKKGFGWENLSKVWYRADTVYLTSNADYAVLAKATLAAAADLNLSKDDIDTLDCAWKAVGVVQGDCQGLQAPAKTTTDTAPTEPSSEESKTAGDGKVGPTPGAAKSSHDGDDDDDEDATQNRIAPKTASGAPSTALGCASTGGAPTSGASAWLVVGIAMLLGRRKRR